MGKTIRALPCHFRPFETGRSLTGECPILRFGWRSLQALPLMIVPTKRKPPPPTRTRSGGTSGLNPLQIFIVWPNSVNMELYEMK